MNLNGDEKRIQRLFREMSLEDTQHAPQFARVLNAASLTPGGSRLVIRPMRVSLVVATLIVVALLAAVVVRQRQTGETQKPDERALVTPSPEPSPVVQPKQRLPRRVGPRVKRVRHRRPAREHAIDTKSLFSWRSPTASLLKSNADDVFITLPRVGESLDKIKSFSPDLWN